MKNYRGIDVERLNDRIIPIREEMKIAQNDMIVTMNTIVNQITAYVDWYFDSTFDKNKEFKSPEEKLRQMENHFDKLNETRIRNEYLKNIRVNCSNALERYTNVLKKIETECASQTNHLGDMSNEMIEEMKNIEKEIQSKRFEENEQYEKMNFNEMIVKTEKWKKENETSLKKKKNRIVEQKYNAVKWKEFFSIDQISAIEQQIQRKLNAILFDSKYNTWEIHCSDFNQSIENESNIVILITTTEGKRCGCFISSEISSIPNKFIADEHAFLFTFENNELKHFPIKEKLKEFELFEESSENLFAIGESSSLFSSGNDILVKKKVKRNECSCLQSSFEYHGNVDALIGRQGYFELERILVFSTQQEDSLEEDEECKQRHESLFPFKSLSYDEFAQIEQWTEMHFDSRLFDSSVDQWEVNASIFDKIIVGKSHLVFMIEDTQNNLFG